jgi:hypothetical protein
VSLSRLLADGNVEWNHGIQIKIRASTYASGWAKAEEVYAILESLHNATVSVDSTSYVVEQFSFTTRIIPLGQDEQRRPQFAINGFVMINET